MFNNSKLLKDLTQEEKSQLEIFCQEKKMKAGELVFKEGEEANAMYLLKEGEIEVYKDIGGEKTVIGKVKAEDILGEMAIFGVSGKRMASAKVIKDSKLITILSFSIKELTIKHPVLMEKIKEIIEIRNIQNKKALN